MNKHGRTTRMGKKSTIKILIYGLIGFLLAAYLSLIAINVMFPYLLSYTQMVIIIIVFTIMISIIVPIIFAIALVAGEAITGRSRS